MPYLGICLNPACHYSIWTGRSGGQAVIRWGAINDNGDIIHNEIKRCTSLGKSAKIEVGRAVSKSVRRCELELFR